MGEKSTEGQMFHLKIQRRASFLVLGRRGVKGGTVSFLGSGAAV